MVMTEAWEGLKRDRNAVDGVIAALAAMVGNRLVTSQAVREQHGNTLTWIGNQPPDAVVFPQTTEEVQEIVRLCAAERVPVIAFGTGTSLEGQVNAPHGGICLDFRDMNRVLAVHAEDLDCVVEPGITRKQLNEHLRDQGVFFPIDPGADASLGGMAATRASGTNAVRYGTMKDNVLSLKVVLANGEVMTTARRAKKIVVGLRPHAPDRRLGRHARHHHRTDAAAYRHSGGDLLGHLPVSLGRGGLQRHDPDHPDRHSGGADRAARCAAGARRPISIRSSRLPETPMLFVEFHGTEAGVAEQSQRFGEIAQEFGGGPFDWATKAEDRSRLWQARHDAYWAQRGLRPGAEALATDVCVPISRLAECVTETQRDIAESKLLAPIVGHVGDGNFHVGLLVDHERRGGGRARRGIPRTPGRAGAGDGRHLHRRARRRPGQDEISGGRARRAGARRHARDQARARSARHHEPGQDR